MRVVLVVKRNDMASETRSVCTVILTMLALINLFSTVRLHVLIQAGLLLKTSPAALAFEGKVLCMQGLNMSTKDEGVRGVKITMLALMHFVCLCMFL